MSLNFNGATEPNEDNNENRQNFSRIPGDASPYEGHYTYKKYGFIQSSNHGADPIAFNIELKKVMETFKEKVRKDEQEQEKMKQPIRKNLAGWKVEHENIKKGNERIINEEIPKLKTKIQNLKDQIFEIRRNPEEYQKDKPNRLSYYFGIFVFIFLTVYLWIFYTSASYSAFFRKFAVDDINVANSMFDAEALSKAFNDGTPAFVLVVSMPFIFLSLGFLIHKYMEKEGWKKYIPLFLLITATFAFDYIIAFEIVKKVYDLQAMNKLGDIPEYNMGMAFQDINFWLIIFAGFVTYLIWGFLFDKLILMHEQFDVVKMQVKLRESEIKDLDKEILACEKQIKEIQNKMDDLEKRIKEAETELDAVFFRPKDFEHVIYQFASGWMQYIEGGLIINEEKKRNLRSVTKGTIESFLSENNRGVFYERA
jgi:hypothetical protein